MAGRTQLAAYIVYSIVLTGWVYPVVVHWCWDSTGWLVIGDDEGHGYSDFAGSGIVHVRAPCRPFIVQWGDTLTF